MSAASDTSLLGNRGMPDILDDEGRLKGDEVQRIMREENEEMDRIARANRERVVVANRPDWVVCDADGTQIHVGVAPRRAAPGGPLLSARKPRSRARSQDVGSDRKGGSMSGFADTTIRLAVEKRQAQNLADMVGEWFGKQLGTNPVAEALTLLGEKLEKRDKRAARKRAKQ